MFRFVILPLLLGYLLFFSILILSDFLEYLYESAFVPFDMLSEYKIKEHLKYVHATQYYSFSLSGCSPDCSSPENRGEVY